MSQAPQHPTFRRAPRGMQRPHPAAPPRQRYRPAHRAPDGPGKHAAVAGAPARHAGPSTPRPRTVAPATYRPAGTRFYPPQVTQPLPRIPRDVSAARPARREGRPTAPAPRAPRHEPRATARRGPERGTPRTPRAATGELPRAYRHTAAALGVATVAGVASALVAPGGTSLAAWAAARATWFAPAGWSLAAWACCAAALAWWLMDDARAWQSRGNGLLARPGTAPQLIALVALAALWLVCARWAPPLLLLVIDGAGLICAGALFVRGRMTGAARRWVPFSLLAGWWFVLLGADLGLIMGVFAPQGDIGAAIATTIYVAVLMLSAYLMRRLCDDIAFGVAVAWGALGVAAHVAGFSVVTAAVVFAETVVGGIGAFVPWETFAAAAHTAERPRVRGGAAAGHAARSSATRRVAGRPATRVAEVAGHRPGRAPAKSLSTQSRVRPTTRRR